MGSAQCMRGLTAAGIEKSLGDAVHVCDVVECVCVRYSVCVTNT